MILINGQFVDVPGVRTLAPNQEPWNKLVRGVPRSTRPQMKILHKTIADDPERIIDAHASSDRWGGARDTVEYWQHARDRKGNPTPVSGTQLVTGHDGSTVCTADLWRFIGWHGHQANDRSWGHEIKETPGGYVNRAALEAAVAVTLVDTVAIGVQWQCPKSYREGHPLERFTNGGRDLIGVFGHRDVTQQRGYHDPGDAVFAMLVVRGFEAFDFAAGQDLDVWAMRQEWLRDLGLYAGSIDGVPGQMTRSALLQLGYPGGIFARWRELPEKLLMPRVIA